MELKQLYVSINGAYEKVMGCLGREERVARFVVRFLKDDSYETFLNGMHSDNWEEAFRGIHTLKGVCLNLGFTELGDMAGRITEMLRGKDMEAAEAMLPEIAESYRKHREAIQAFALANQAKEREEI